jgi:hypothetical protein
MAFMVAENSFLALKTICHGNNWQKVASTLSAVFHTGDYLSRGIDSRVLKARGYDRLRELVSSCVADLRDDDLRFPDGYDRMVNRLFASQGLPTP